MTDALTNVPFRSTSIIKAMEEAQMLVQAEFDSECGEMRLLEAHGEEHRNSHYIPSKDFHETTLIYKAYMDDLRATLKKANSASEQEEALEYTIEQAFRDVQVSWKSPKVLNLLQRTYDQACMQVCQHTAENGYSWVPILGRLQEKGEINEGAYDALCGMVKNYQQAQGICEEHIAATPFDLAWEQYFIKNPEALERAENNMLKPEEEKAIASDADDIINDLLEPYQDALPDGETHPEYAYLIRRALKLHANNDAAATQNKTALVPRKHTETPKMELVANDDLDPQDHALYASNSLRHRACTTLKNMFETLENDSDELIDECSAMRHRLDVAYERQQDELRRRRAGISPEGRY